MFTKTDAELDHINKAALSSILKTLRSISSASYSQAVGSVAQRALIDAGLQILAESRDLRKDSV